MSVPKPPVLTPEQVAKEILAVLKSGKGFYYHVIWSKVLGVQFRNSPENDSLFRRMLDRLTECGAVQNENGWYALRELDKTGEAQIMAFSREYLSA